MDNPFDIFDNVGIGIFVLDSDFNVLYWNNCLVDWTLIEKTDIHCNPICKFFPGFKDLVVRTRISEVFNEGIPVILTSSINKNLLDCPFKQYRRKMTFEMTVTAINLGSDQVINHALFTVSNVTEITNKIKTLKNLNRIACEAQKALIKKNKEKDTFISILGHDLMSLIGGNVQLIQLTDLNDPDVISKEKVFDQLSKNTKTAYELLKDLIGWGKASLGTIHFSPVRQTLKPIFEKVIEIYKVQATDRKLNIKVDCKDDDSVFADIDMLSVILRNLLKNAIKFTHCGGAIKFKVKKTKRSTRIFVIDDGVGIPPEKLKKILTFEMVNSSPGISGEKGFGLGLHILQEYVKLHNGNVNIKSTLNVGTKVCVELPNEG